MLVPVQFPRYLRVPNFVEVEESNFIPRLKRRSPAIQNVEMPVDFLAVVQVFISQEVKTMLADAFGLPTDLMALGRKSIAQKINSGGSSSGAKKNRPS